MSFGPVKRNVSWGPSSRQGSSGSPRLLDRNNSSGDGLNEMYALQHYSANNRSLNSSSHSPHTKRNMPLRMSADNSSSSESKLKSPSLERSGDSVKTLSKRHGKSVSFRQNRWNRWLLYFCVAAGLVYLFWQWDQDSPSGTTGWSSSSMDLPKKGSSNKRQTRLRAGTIENLRLSHMPPTLSDLERLNSKLTDVTDILTWLDGQRTLYQVRVFQPFDAAGMVLMHEMKQIFGTPEEGLHMFHLDSLHEFPATYRLISRCEEFYSLKTTLTTYKPAGFDNKAAFDTHFGNIWRTDRANYDRLTIHEPMARALEHAQIWVAPDQGAALFEMDNEGRLKVNPLARWSDDKIWNYIREQRVPYNSLYDHGYTEIGDEMLTFPKRSTR